MAGTTLASDRSVIRATTYQTAPLGTVSKKLVLVWVMNVDPGGGGAQEPIATASGLALTNVTTIVVSGTNDRRLTCFRAVGGPASVGPVTFTFQRSQDACAWSIVSYSDFDGSGVNGANAVAQTARAVATGTTLQLPVPAPLTESFRSIVAGAVILRNSQAISPDPSSPDLNPTEIAEQQLPAAGPGTLETADWVGSPMASWTWAGNDEAAAIAIEIRPAPSSYTADLVRKFEPIMVLDANETVVPADAKRYVEHCALWSARPPYDIKGNWGDGVFDVQPFPRVPQVTKEEGIAARDGEHGRRIDTAITGDRRGWFLELKGWSSNDPDPSAVTQASRNTFSNREKLRIAYGGPDSEGGIPALRDSRFWYHAEFFRTEHLRTLLERVAAPDLVKVLKARKHAALLNYYFFFPVHDEPLGGCPGIDEAQEFGGFCGEWRCFSLLLERDSEDVDYAPTFVGTTKRFITDVPAGIAQEVDKSDPAQRLTMHVTKASAIGMVSDHPRIFVAKGTHSLYLGTGDVAAVGYPPEVGPQQCGKAEGPLPEYIAPEDVHKDDFSAVLLAKIAALSFLAGIGFVLALCWAVIEAALAVGGGTVRVRPSFDSPAPDQVGSPETGKIIKPGTVILPDTGIEIHDWKSKDGLTQTIGTRRYDFLVDRAQQPWWPGEDGEGGFMGRWGPRVEHDPFGRRAGMSFPEFWKLFFLALNTGFDKKIF